MKKLAIFVEGYTELRFIENLVCSIAGKSNVLFDKREIVGGASMPRKILMLENIAIPTNEKYYVLIVDCHGDSQVKSRILEEHEGLTRAGYSKIIAVRDVRPAYAVSEIPSIEQNFPKYIKTALIPVELILSVMEIEAWFIAEQGHYSKIHVGLTLDQIRNAIGIDITNIDSSTVAEPAQMLNNIYSSVGEVYNKSLAYRTVDALDYENIYLSLTEQIPYLKKLVQSIDNFLS